MLRVNKPDEERIDAAADVRPGGCCCEDAYASVPAEAKGPEAEVMAVFRRVRDDIAAKVPSLLDGPLPGR